MWQSRDFAAFRTRSGADRRLIFESMLWLALARSAILVIPFRWTTRLFALTPGDLETAVDQPSRELASRIGWALRISSDRSPWQSTCLAQALAGTAMLRRRRIPATLAMGIARKTQQPAGLEAHAWLYCSGDILTGAVGYERYNVVAKYTLSRHCGLPHA